MYMHAHLKVSSLSSQLKGLSTDVSVHSMSRLPGHLLRLASGVPA